MRCTSCSSRATVLETRTIKAGRRRTYGCVCGEKFNTIETIIPRRQAKAQPAKVVALDTVWLNIRPGRITE